MIINIKGNIKTGEVILNGKQLTSEESLKVRNHSPHGFSWGYGGSGPAQLALAILLELLPEQEALMNYQKFKWDLIAMLPESDFDIDIDLKDFGLCSGGSQVDPVSR